jgi:hypothetical protein
VPRVEGARVVVVFEGRDAAGEIVLFDRQTFVPDHAATLS